MSWLLFSLLQSLAALICQFCFSLPPPSWHDWPCLLRPPGNPPRHARPRVCAQSFIWLPLKDCHAFTSLLVSLLLLRCRRQRLLWMAWWYVVVWVGGVGDVYRTVTIDVIYLTCSVQLSHLFCREPAAHTSAFVSGSSKKKNIIFEQKQIIKSFVNADCKLLFNYPTASLHSCPFYSDFKCFCFFWRGPVSEPLWPPLWHFDFLFLFSQK